MEDIAKEAELSPGTLYLYFKNKEELYASLSLRILQYLHIRVEHVIKENELDCHGKLKALMEAMYDVYDFDPLIIINMFHLQSSETLKNLSDQLLAEIKTLSQKSIGSIAQIFEEGIEKGIFVNRKTDTLRNSARFRFKRSSAFPRCHPSPCLSHLRDYDSSGIGGSNRSRGSCGSVRKIGLFQSYPSVHFPACYLSSSGRQG